MKKAVKSEVFDAKAEGVLTEYVRIEMELLLRFTSFFYSYYFPLWFCLYGEVDNKECRSVEVTASLY